MATSPALWSEVRLSLWLRVLLTGSFGLLVVALTVAAANRLSGGFSILGLLEVGGALAALALAISSVRASCNIRVDEHGVTMRFWLLFRVQVSSTEVIELRADEWNSWDYGGYGLKGGRKRGWLLNATADGTGAGDKGIVVCATNGRTYRVEVKDPEQFALQAIAVLFTPAAA